MELLWHSYKYYPYELELARREVRSLLPRVKFIETDRGIKIGKNSDPHIIDRLVYFAGRTDGLQVAPTLQARLERVNGNGLNRQSTRYSAHGLHEYKGKFNPQIVRGVLNILDIPLGAKVIDPFCGSGTSLLECAHLGMQAIGTDINPLAVFIANAKLCAFSTPVTQLRESLHAILKRYKRSSASINDSDRARRDYLLSWFEPSVFDVIERLRFTILGEEQACVAPLLTIASNLLREYSLQDPNDLRIRRRKTPLPERPFIETFEEAALQFLAKLSDTQTVLGEKATNCKAILSDSRTLSTRRDGMDLVPFDCALTSPPYATALPYIDTQRLSLVWLGLVPASEILRLEAQLVGSREVRGQTKRDLMDQLKDNTAHLPDRQAKYCLELQEALSNKDGFRRQAVPLLLYRYFSGMAEVFRSLRPCMKNGAPFALIVGSNHTVLSGKRFDIETPNHLAQIAESCGWHHEETFPLQVYQRYGYHMSNAVNTEALVVVNAA